MPTTITFNTLNSDIIPAVLDDLEFKYSEDLLLDLRLALSIDYPTYKFIRSKGYFHLLQGNALAEAAFLPSKPFFVELKPGAELLKSFTLLGKRDEVTRYILDGSENGMAIRNENEWYATSVTQESDVPEGIASDGRLFQGYTTSHGDADDVPSTPVEILGNLMDEWKGIESILNKYNMAFERDDEVVSGNTTMNGHQWAFFIYETNRIFVINSSYPFFAVEGFQYKLIREITQINNGLTIGNFDFDLEEGVISFRISFDAGQNILAPDIFERMLIANMATTGRYYDQIEKAAS